MAFCLVGTARATDPNTLFREHLRAMLPSSEEAASDRDALLRIAGEVAEEVYGNLNRREAASQQYRSLPLAADNWHTHWKVAERVQPQAAEVPLWAKPWSPVATAERAVQWHEATMRPPAVLAVTALLAQISPPKVTRANMDWRAPVLIIEGVLSLYVVHLHWQAASELYQVETVERYSLAASAE